MAEVIAFPDNRKVITVTEIGVFKRCRLMWSFSYQDKITPIKEMPYFFTGRMTHRVLADWTEKPELILEEIWAKVLQEEIEFYKTRYTEAIGVGPNDAEIDVVLADALMPFHMVQNYRQHWHTPLPKGFRLLETEQTCLIKIPTLDNVFLEGTLDGLILDEETETLYVLERKTYENRPRIQVLDSNEQFIGYVWLLKQLFPDYRVGGILYDGLWKRETPPKGRKFEDLFMRQLIKKDDDEIARWEQNLILVAQDMVNAPNIYPNRVWQGCHDDKAYEPICTALSKNDDYEFVLEANYAHKSSIKWFDDEESDL